MDKGVLFLHLRAMSGALSIDWWGNTDYKMAVTDQYIGR